MSVEIGVLSFFLLMIIVGIALIFMTGEDSNKKPGYRLKICTAYAGLAKLRYSKNYGFTWRTVPLGITGKYEPRFFYCVKLEDEDKVKYITLLFETYLNDYPALLYYIHRSNEDLKKTIEVYRSEQTAKLIKTSIM